MDENKNYYQEDSELRSVVERYENMLKQKKEYYFDVHEFEKIIDHYLEGNHFNKAIDAVEYGIKQHPSSTSLLIKKVQVLAEKGEPAPALKLIIEIEQLETTNSELSLLKGNVYNQLGRVREAEKAFERALLYTYESKEEVLYDIGLSFEYIKQYQQALKYFNKAHELNPDNLNIIYDLARCYDKIHAYDKSIYFFEKYLDNEPFSDSVWYNLGMVYYKMENYKKAVDCFDFAIAINDKYVSAFLNKANALENWEKHREAIRVYFEYLEQEKDNAMAYTYIGECYEKLEEYDNAITYYQKAVKIDPEFAEAWYGIAVCFLYKRSYADALFYINKAISFDEENSDFWFALGNIHTNLNAFTDAISAYIKATRIDPYDYEAWLNHAELEFKQNGIERAIAVLKDSYGYNYDIALINYHLSGYYYISGEYNLAHNFFEKGLKLDYHEHDVVFRISAEAKSDERIQYLLEQYKSK